MLLKYRIYVFCSLCCLLCSFALHAAPYEKTLQGIDGPSIGNVKGKIVLIEFFDYQCTYCRRMSAIVEAIVHANPNVRVIFKDVAMQGPMSTIAARAALAAHQQGKYSLFSKRLLHAPQPLSLGAIYHIAQLCGLNVPQLKKDMYGPKATKALRDNNLMVDALNLAGTPAFFLGNVSQGRPVHWHMFVGAVSKNKLQKAIDLLH